MLKKNTTGGSRFGGGRVQENEKARTRKYMTDGNCRSRADILAYFYNKLPGQPYYTVVRRPISANPGLNFNLGFYFFCSKAFFRIIFSILFRASDHQIVDKKNKTEFAF